MNVAQKTEKFLQELEDLCSRYNANIRAEGDDVCPQLVLVVDGYRFPQYTSTISG